MSQFILKDNEIIPNNNQPDLNWLSYSSIRKIASICSNNPEIQISDQIIQLARNGYERNREEIENLPPAKKTSLNWSIIKEGLTNKSPSRFFEVLRDTGEIGNIFPKISDLIDVTQSKIQHPDMDVLSAMIGVTQSEAHHPEGDVWNHTMLCLDVAAKNNNRNLAVLFSALVHDLGKALTDPSLWPKHYGHDAAGVPVVEALCKALGVPENVKQVAMIATAKHHQVHGAMDMREGKIVDLVHSLDKDIKDVLDVCLIDARGRKGFEDEPYPQKEYLLKIGKMIAGINTNYLDDGLERRIKEKLIEKNKDKNNEEIESMVHKEIEKKERDERIDIIRSMNHPDKKMVYNLLGSSPYKYDDNVDYNPAIKVLWDSNDINEGGELLELESETFFGQIKRASNLLMGKPDGVYFGIDRSEINVKGEALKIKNAYIVYDENNEDVNQWVKKLENGLHQWDEEGRQEIDLIYSGIENRHDDDLDY